MRCSSAAIGGRGAPVAPVPSSASTARPTLGHGPSAETSRTPSASASEAMRSFSGLRVPGAEVTHTGMPSRCSTRAVTQPSPPLLPGPAVMRRPSRSRAAYRSAMTVATARPADSISVASSMPADSAR